MSSEMKEMLKNRLAFYKEMEAFAESYKDDEAMFEYNGAVCAITNLLNGGLNPVDFQVFDYTYSLSGRSEVNFDDIKGKYFKEEL